MASLAPLPQLALTFLFSSIWGSVTVLGILWQIIRRGPSKFFYVKTRDTPPKCLEDSKLGTHHEIRLKDVKIHYVAKGDEGKPLMLFVHGFPEFWYSWRNQLKEFSKDYKAVAIDMRGYGDSDKPSSVSDYHMDKLAGDINELVPALGYEKCVLVAHDWGGAVAGYVAAKYPQIVDKLVLCNIPHGRAFQKHIQTHWSQALKSWYMFMFQVPYLPEMYLRAGDFEFINAAFRKPPMGAKKGFTDEDIEAFKYSSSRPGGLTNPINYYRAAMRYAQPKLENKGRITMPTLMVWGTGDGALEKEMATLSGDFIDNFTLEFIEGASHWVQQEEPEKVNKAMREFLSGKKRE